MELYKGEVLSEGIAVGNIHKINEEPVSTEYRGIAYEKNRFQAAVQISLDQIEVLKKERTENADYLTIQGLLIGDYALAQNVLRLINEGNSAVSSVHKALENYVESLAVSSNTYLQQRTLDIMDIRNRIIQNMEGTTSKDLDCKKVIYAKELHPSFLIQHKQKILGIITEDGGFSSHGAILCRQWNIPYMVCELELTEEDMVVLDTRQKIIIVHPEPEIIQRYKNNLLNLEQESYQAIPHKGFGFYANVSSNNELEKVLEYGFDGVGLYRTEMIFMNTNRPYGYEEQLEIYSEAVEKLKGKVVCFRTFDIGDDKQLSYVKSFKKGVDNYIHNPLLFETQIKAMIAANHYNNIRIMFPMITSEEDFKFLKRWVLQIQKTMKNTSKIKIGMMLETKEALNHIQDFKDADFISIGTNDLTEDIYHIKRDTQNQRLNSYIKDLTEQLSKVVVFCDQQQICLSVCGELAAIASAAQMFYHIGIRNLSVAAPAIRVLNKVYKEYIKSI